MRKREKKGRILKFTYSESSHQIRMLAKNRIFANFCQAKIVFRPHVEMNTISVILNMPEVSVKCIKSQELAQGMYSMSNSDAQLYANHLFYTFYALVE